MKIADTTRAVLAKRWVPSRGQKRLINLIVDAGLVALCLYLAYALRFGALDPFGRFLPDGRFLLYIVPLLSLPIFGYFRLHHVKLGAIDAWGITQFLFAAGCISAVLMILSYFFKVPSPRTVPVIFAALYFVSATGLRLIALRAFASVRRASGAQKRVLIYGAGAAGAQLAAALQKSHEVEPVAFIDDDPSLRGVIVSGLRVRSASEISRLVAERGIRQIVVAMPSTSRAKRAEIMRQLSVHQVEVRIMPSYIDLMTGRQPVEALQPVTADDLLGRDSVDLEAGEVARAYAGRTVMVTGAGGSIGSELCRQLLDCAPQKLILFEQSEYALYSIFEELRALTKDTDVSLVARLGSVNNPARVASVLRDEGVDIILHAAAYKHVPIVEENELEGARNNVVGTRVVAQAAVDAGVERFILVSTDKAVRPTNIMGATKRMAELVIQDIQTRSPKTRFAMVRFGNVLGSSGSVIPLFRKQIAQGGPVTVTHADVTRFFMTISEASRLVLLAGAYATGGDVFVLDMGKPQRIIDIARQMIRLSGCSVKEPGAPNGDIEIQITGLRPGEKLYEELLIDDASLVATPHPKILRASETPLSQIEVASMLRELEASLETGDAARLRALVQRRVDGYHAQTDDIAAVDSPKLS